MSLSHTSVESSDTLQANNKTTWKIGILSKTTAQAVFAALMTLGVVNPAEATLILSSPEATLALVWYIDGNIRDGWSGSYGFDYNWVSYTWTGTLIPLADFTKWGTIFTIDAVLQDGTPLSYGVSGYDTITYFGDYNFQLTNSTTGQIPLEWSMGTSWFWQWSLFSGSTGPINAHLRNPQPTSSVSEPESIALLGTALAGLAATRRRKPRGANPEVSPSPSDTDKA